MLLTGKQVSERRAPKELSEDLLGVAECEREAGVTEVIVFVGGGAPVAAAVQALLAVLIVHASLPLCTKMSLSLF